MELPDNVSLVRLRGIEEMAKLMRRQGGEGLNQWVAQWQQGTKLLAIEKLWALYYAGARQSRSRQRCMKPSARLRMWTCSLSMPG